MYKKKIERKKMIQKINFVILLFTPIVFEKKEKMADIKPLNYFKNVWNACLQQNKLATHATGNI